jgi:hypothetical protein
VIRSKRWRRGGLATQGRLGLAIMDEDALVKS